MIARAGLILAILAVAAHGEPMRVLGSSTTAMAVRPATNAIAEATGADLAFETSMGSSYAIRSVANGRVDLAMSTRAVSSEDRSINPRALLFDVQIGIQVLVPIVSKATWDAGLRTVKKDDLIKLYEGDLSTWKAVGGPDLKAAFINPTDGRGVWEPFVIWLYGDLHRVGPGRRWKSAASNEQARDLVLATPGAVSVAPPRWVDGQQIFALTIIGDDGAKIEPSEASFRSGTWPLTRPIVLVAGEKPTGLLRKMLEFMVSPKGQEYVTAAEFLPRPQAEEELAAKFK